MKSVAMLHTVKSVYESFGAQLREAVGEITLYNMLDDFLALDANARGEFTANNMERLRLDLASLSMTGADCIVVTCSTLTPHIAKAAEGLTCPVIAIDGAMIDAAAHIGGRVVVMATAKSAVEPVTNAIIRRAEELDNRVSVEACVCVDAMTALRSGDRNAHDALLMKTAEGIIGVPDCVVLAQASMAHVDEPLFGLLGCPVLQSPKLCIEALAKGGTAV